MSDMQQQAAAPQAAEEKVEFSLLDQIIGVHQLKC